MVSFKSIGEKTFSTFFEKTTELELLRWLPTVEPKRSIGWENGGQIRIQREILHRYGEFQVNGREKIFDDVPPLWTARFDFGFQWTDFVVR